MILPDSTLSDDIAVCANQTLDELRLLSRKNICADMTGDDLLTMRARLMHSRPGAQISANGCCHLLQTVDAQWVALNLARDCDWSLLPALFKDPSPVNTWQQVQAQIKKMPADELLVQGRTLGLPLALADKNTNPPLENWFSISCSGEHSNQRQILGKQTLVLDLSSLWAGPLCSQLLLQSGAHVIKVESKHRPDGARLNTSEGGKEFFAWLNQGKELVELDFSNTGDIEQLIQLIGQADIVIEGSRPRALQQLGIDAEAIVKQQPGLIWVSITGYGRREPQASWVAFGDDAAISAGLFDIIDAQPVFIGDAIADPLTGLHAALAAHMFWQKGDAVLLDVNLHAVSRRLAGE
jgi:hypothetical protein